jgi:hypothetical protein
MVSDWGKYNVFRCLLFRPGCALIMSVPPMLPPAVVALISSAAVATGVPSSATVATVTSTGAAGVAPYSFAGLLAILHAIL